MHRHRPGATKVFAARDAQSSAPVRVRINSAGYRGPELDGARSHRRVVVFGDSYVAAVRTREDRTFPARLGAHLSEATGEEFEVINAGVVGYGPDQVLLRMQDELPALEADLVVVALYSNNDYGDLLRNHLFELDEEGALVHVEPRLDPGLVHEFERADEQVIVGKLLEQALSGVGVREVYAASAEVRRTRYHGQAECREEFARYQARRQDPTVTNLLYDHRDSDLACDPEAASSRYKRALMGAVLGELARTARENEVPLVLAILPGPVDVCESHELGRVDGARYPEYRREALTSTLAELARERGVPYVDLFGAFRAHEEPRALFLPRFDDHWNEAGQELAARELAGFILERAWLSESP